MYWSVRPFRLVRTRKSKLVQSYGIEQPPELERVRRAGADDLLDDSTKWAVT